jgi:hypothetical protein
MTPKSLGKRKNYAKGIVLRIDICLLLKDAPPPPAKTLEITGGKTVGVLQMYFSTRAEVLDQVGPLLFSETSTLSIRRLSSLWNWCVKWEAVKEVIT